MNYRILLAEDEEHLRETIKLNLELEGYSVQAVSDGAKALKAFKEQRFNLVVLDVMMPLMDGLEVCETIRLENQEVPILFLTARGEGADRVLGLKKGADDYLVKPFNLEEFLLRVQNLIKRTVREAGSALNTYTIGNKTISFGTFEIMENGKVIFQITKKETYLLKLLIERKNEVVSRELILEKVWGYDVYPSTRTIDNFILNFRKYFEQNPKEPRYFHSVRGVGYKFTE